MRNALIILFLFVSVALKATTYYVASGGNDSNPGTITQPWATWNYGFNHLKAGDILYIRGGTYTGLAGGSSNMFGVRADGLTGTSGSHITISAYPGETPILDCSALNTTTNQNVGIGLYNSTYVDLIGLTVINVTQHAVNALAAPGFYESNVTYITHTQCTIHHCGDGFTIRDSYNYIYYKNCDVYEIADTYNDPSGALPGSLANGFYCAPAAGTHIYYTGCRAWNCSDDGWDEFGGAGYVEITNCWSFNNGVCPAGGPISYTIGDGSGFKLGPTTSSPESGYQRILKNCVAVGNLGPGIDQNASSSSTNVQHAIYNCVTANNKGPGFQYYYDHVSTFKNNISFNNASSDEFGSGSTADHNSWQTGSTITSADFVSTDASVLSGPRKSDGSLPDVSFMHLASGSKLIDAGVDVGLTYAGNGPDIGAFENTTGGTVTPPTTPVFVSAAVENVTPSLVELTYNTTLANIVPATSAFTVMVNSVARSISSVAISGTKVQLTLASPVVYGNTLTVTYTKPATSPVQIAGGGQAATITNQAVTNRVASSNPGYVSSSVENAAPSQLVMTYNMTLANVVPAASAFTVMVNSTALTVSSVAISGTKVQLALSSPLKYGDIITVAYTKPATNPLQTSTGGAAASFSAQSTVNNIINPTKNVTSVTVTMTVSPNHVHKIINVALAYTGLTTDLMASITPSIIRITNLAGTLFLENQITTGATSIKIPVNLATGVYKVTMLANGFEMASQRMVVYQR